VIVGLAIYPPGIGRREREAEAEKKRIDAISTGAFPLPDLTALRAVTNPLWVSGNVETADLSNKPVPPREAIDA
jgi:hypothetical protein